MSVGTIDSFAHAWRSHLPFALAGGVCIVVGGLIAAATAVVPSAQSAWAAAYLVLIGGVAQLLLGGGQLALTGRPQAPRLIAVELALWNVGDAVVIAGALVGSRLLVAAGGVLLVAALAAFLRGVASGAGHTGWLWAYRALTAFLLVSTAAGTILTH